MPNSLHSPAFATQGESGIVDHSYQQALSWSGIIAGALVIGALGFILVVLGFGLGLSTTSPWVFHATSGKAIAAGAIAWLVLSQIIASGMGGYLAGRLRHRWARVHLDEIHFRDSAQGFLAWALAMMLSAAFLLSASSRLIGESMIIDAGEPGLSSSHLSMPVSGRTRVTDPDTASPSALTRGDDRLSIDTERKNAAYGALWLFIALLGGAFSAALFATVGGRHRDHLFTFKDS